MYLFIILLFGVFLRLAYIIKPEGLWNDEYVSWMIAFTPFNDGFVDEVLKQCHMPLYYLYLKLFIFLTSNSDTILRLSSVIPSIAAIWVMYKIGILRDKFTGYLLAGMTSVSAFLVYYSQELRFYSLLFLFSAMLLYFLLKLRKEKTKYNIIGYLLSAFLILFTHTIGFVFVFFSLLYLIFAIRLKRIFYIVFSCVVILSLPITGYIFLHSGHSQWWGEFSIRNIVFLFTDFFSPILTNNVNIPSVVLYKKGLVFAAILILPTVLALSCIFYSILKIKELRGIFYIALNTTIVLTVAALLGKFVFITKYDIEILPILMYLFAVGAGLLKPFFKYMVVVLWFVIQIGYFFTPDYPSKQVRNEGNRIAAALIAKSGIKPRDNLIITYYNWDRFYKYIDLMKFNVVNIDKSKVSEYVSDNGKILPQNYLVNREFLDNKLSKIINDKKKTYVLFLDSVSFFPDIELRKIAKEQKYIDKVHPIYLEMSVLKNEIINYGKKCNLDVKSTKMGSWSLYIINGGK